MSKLFLQQGFTLIGAPWSGKSTVGKLTSARVERQLNVSGIFHDMDNDGLEGPVGWGTGGVAKKLSLLGDDGFLAAEGDFILENYGTTSEGKTYTLDRLLFAASGSLPLTKAMEHIRKRSTVILLDVPIRVLEHRASPNGRSDGNTRIVGMNGDTPRFSSLRAALEYRGEIYKQSAHITLAHRDEPVSDTAHRLTEIILNHQPLDASLDRAA